MKEENKKIDLEEILDFPNLSFEAKASLFDQILDHSSINKNPFCDLSNEFLTEIFNYYDKPSKYDGMSHIPKNIIEFIKNNIKEVKKSNYPTLLTRVREINENNLIQKGKNILKRIAVNSEDMLPQVLEDFKREEKYNEYVRKLPCEKQGEFYFSVLGIIRDKLNEKFKNNPEEFEEYKYLIKDIYQNSFNFLISMKGDYQKLLKLSKDPVYLELVNQEDPTYINNRVLQASLILDSQNDSLGKKFLNEFKEKNSISVSRAAYKRCFSDEISYDYAIQHMEEYFTLLLNIHKKKNLEKTFKTLDSFLRTIILKVNERAESEIPKKYSKLSEEGMKYELSSYYIRRLAALSKSFGLDEISKDYLNELEKGKNLNVGIEVDDFNIKLQRDEYLNSNYSNLEGAYLETKNYKSFLKNRIWIYESTDLKNTEDYLKIKDALNAHELKDIDKLTKIRDFYLHEERIHLNQAIAITSLIVNLDETRRSELEKLESINNIINPYEDQLLVSNLYEKKDNSLTQILKGY